MKFLKTTKFALLPGLALMLAACGEKDEGTAASETVSATPTAGPIASDITLDTVDQRVSYGVGYNVGANIAAEGNLDVDLDAIIAGLQDGIAKADTRIEREALQAAFTELQERAAAAMSSAAEANLVETEAWLQENAQRDMVTTTESGLQYEVLESGPDDGATPGPSDTVEVHYHGTLTDGTVFDSSIDRGESITFPVDRVIAGWTEALQMMSVGDKWKLYIPPQLGYGPDGAGEIPPNAALIFEVELIGIE